jgi:hypothetical protein
MLAPMILTGGTIMGILLSFLELLLYIAIIILLAFAIRWLIAGFLGWPIDPMVYKWEIGRAHV